MLDIPKDISISNFIKMKKIQIEVICYLKI